MVEKPHFLQSDIWKEFQNQLGNKIITGSGNGWSYTGMVKNDQIGPYIYIPYGPFAVSITTLKHAISDLKNQAMDIGAYVIYVEPMPPVTKEEARALFKHKGVHRQAHRTIRIDLSGSEDEIIAKMNPTRRNEYRNYDKKGFILAKDNSKQSMDEFYRLLTLSSGKKGFYIREKSFFDKMFDTLVQSGNASIFAARKEGKTEVAILVYDDDDTRYYAQVGRDLSADTSWANAPLISYAIIDAKRAGKKHFDLYGISESDDKIDEKSGFTKFKKTFGGEVIQFAGAWEIPISKPKYFVKKTLQTAKKLAKKLRK